MRLIKTALIAVIVVLFVVAVIRIISPEDNWVCQKGIWQPHGNPNTPMPKSPCIETNTPQATPSSKNEDTNLKDYINVKMGFSTKLPKEVDVKENLDGTISFSKWGPTQKTQTELFDGYSINIDQAKIGTNKDLKSLIEADIEQKKEQLSSDFKVINPITSKYNGFTFKSEDAFGEVDYYYLPQSNNNFLLITSIVKDPGNLGFEKIVGDIVSRISMSK